MADPAWSNVWGLWHCEGASGDTTTPNVVSDGDALTSPNSSVTKVSTAKSKFGTASLSSTNSGWKWRGGSLTIGASSQITIEGYWWANSTTPNISIWPTINGGTSIKNQLQFLSGNVSIWNATPAEVVIGTATFTANAWNHVRWVIDLGAATKHRVFVKGVQVGSSTSTLLTTGAAFLILGDDNDSSSTTGYIDEIRGCYEALNTTSTSFTPPTTPFPETHAQTGDTTTTFGTGKVVLTQTATGNAPATTFGTPSNRLIQPATTIGQLTAFGSPGNLLTQAAAGFAPIAFGTPTALMTLTASSIDTSTAFGDPHALFPQWLDATGFDGGTTFGTPKVDIGGLASGWNETVFGMPAILNIAVGWSETAFGTGSVVFNAIGFETVNFGTPAALDAHRVSPMGIVSQFGTPTTPTDRTQEASGWLTGEFGQDPTSISFTEDGSATYNLRATWLDARAQFGLAVALSPFVADATGDAPATVFGEPAATQSDRLDATALDPQTTFGEPTVLLGQRASGWKPAAFGQPTVLLTQAATGFGPLSRFGTPAQFGPHMTTGRVHTRYGQPRALRTFNYPAEGFTATEFGTPAALERNRASALPPATRFGTPLLVRNPAC